MVYEECRLKSTVKPTLSIGQQAWPTWVTLLAVIAQLTCFLVIYATRLLDDISLEETL